MIICIPYNISTEQQAHENIKGDARGFASMILFVSNETTDGKWIYLEKHNT